MIIVAFTILLILIDWRRLLNRLIKHRQLVPAVRWVSYFPLLSNLYLRLYFYMKKVVPGSSHPTIRALRDMPTKYGALRVNIENTGVYF
jgi:hypothetical protein